MNNAEKMNSRPTMPLSEFNNPERGMLIGFKAFSNEDKITAAYPIWSINGDDLRFVLYFDKSTGRPVLDGTRLGPNNPIYINTEPFKTDIEIMTSTTFGKELQKFFT
jgi:hypothetical protein